MFSKLESKIEVDTIICICINWSFFMVLTSKMSEIKAYWSPLHIGTVFENFILGYKKVLSIFIFYALACRQRGAMFFSPKQHKISCRIFCLQWRGCCRKISTSNLKCLAPFCFINKKLLEVHDSEEE